MKGLKFLTLLSFLFEKTVRIVRANIFSLSKQGYEVENDQCINALPIADARTVYSNITYATVDAANVSKNCYDDRLPQYPGIWYKFEGTGEPFVLRSCDSIAYIYLFIKEIVVRQAFSVSVERIKRVRRRSL